MTKKKLFLLPLFLATALFAFFLYSTFVPQGKLKLYWFIPDGVRSEPELFTLYQWAEEGKLPNIKKLMERGSYGYSKPTFPGHTPTNFATLLTGATPLRHGITDGPMHVEGKPLDSVAVAGQRVFHPMERLHDPHGGTPGPVQPTRCRLLELDDQVVQLNASAARVRVDEDARRHCCRQTDVIRRGHPVDEHADLIASSNRIDDSAVVRDRGLIRQAVHARRVIETAVDASKLSLLYEPLQDFVDGGAAAEVEEVDGSPDLVAGRFGDTGGNGLPQVSHPISVHKFRTRCQRMSSDICPQVSDINCARNCAKTTSKRGHPGPTLTLEV